MGYQAPHKTRRPSQPLNCFTLRRSMVRSTCVQRVGTLPSNHRRSTVIKVATSWIGSGLQPLSVIDVHSHLTIYDSPHSHSFPPLSCIEPHLAPLDSIAFRRAYPPPNARSPANHQPNPTALGQLPHLSLIRSFRNQASLWLSQDWCILIWVPLISLSEALSKVSLRYAPILCRCRASL